MAAAKVVSEEPPYEINGNGTPVRGIIPAMADILIKV